MRSLAADEEELIAALRKTLASRPHQPITEDQSLEICRLVAAITRQEPDSFHSLGPLCTTADVVDHLGVSRQAVNKAVKEARILAVRHKRGDWRYPTWQLVEEGRIVPGLGTVLARLHDFLDPTQSAAWFLQPCKAIDNLTPAQWLLERRPINSLVAAAEERSRRAK
ncbi:MAG: hypothetical protein Q4P06_03370 [Actinomycetaceae bacterium]|nr:hypothetical protein [Actinomycetaceae bacterium]